VDKNVLFDIKKKKWYWDLKGKAIDRTIRRIGFGRRETR
jgi:hypothetical protein